MVRFATAAVSVTLLAVGVGVGVGASTTEPVTTEPGGPEPPCLLDAAAVAQASGTPIVEVSMSGGAVASTSAGTGLLGAPDLSWTGCDYATRDGSELHVSELVAIEGGADALGQFDQLRALAVASDTIASSVGHIGAAAFVNEHSDLLVTDGTETLRFHVGDITGVDGASALAEVASGILALGATDDAARCAALAELVPKTWGKPGVMTAGGGSENGFAFTSCAVELPELGGLTLQLDVADGRGWYDFELDQQRPLTPVPIEGLGDEAYWYGRIDGVVVRADDHVLVAAGEDADGNVLDQAMLDALAAAAVSALTPTVTTTS